MSQDKWQKDSLSDDMRIAINVNGRIMFTSVGTIDEETEKAVRLVLLAPDMLKELNHCLGILCTPNETDEIRLTCKEQCDTIVRIKNILDKINGKT